MAADATGLLPAVRAALRALAAPQRPRRLRASLRPTDRGRAARLP